MNDEEMDKTMKFLLEQQAQFAAGIRQITEVQARSVKDIQQLREAETTLMRAMTTVVGMAGQLDGRVSRLETALADLAERISAFIAALRNGKKGN
jgi:septation ring formation regulator EzrA